jgi:hypothetical protein
VADWYTSRYGGRKILSINRPQLRYRAEKGVRLTRIHTKTCTPESISATTVSSSTELHRGTRRAQESPHQAVSLGASSTAQGGRWICIYHFNQLVTAQPIVVCQEETTYNSGNYLPVNEMPVKPPPARVLCMGEDLALEVISLGHVCQSRPTLSDFSAIAARISCSTSPFLDRFAWSSTVCPYRSLYSKSLAPAANNILTISTFPILAA